MAGKKGSWCGIGRDEIDWFPTIDYTKCTGCMACVNKCKNGVYSRAKGKPRVAKPKNCVVGCTGCQPVCPVGAISHPSRGYLRSLAGRPGFKASCSCGGK